MQYFALLLALPVLSLQDDLRDFDSNNPVVARRALEVAVRAGDEKALQEAAKTSKRARTALAKRRANERFGEASPPLKLVSYSADGKPTREALEDFSKLLGVRFTNYKIEGAILTPLKDPVTLKLEYAYPLQSLDALARALGATWWREEDKIVLSPGGLGVPPFESYFRHFHIYLHRFREERKVNLLGKESKSAILQVRVEHDQECRFAGFKSPRLLEVRDDRGRPLQRKEYRELPSFGGFGGISIAVPMVSPPRGTKKLALVRGEMRVLLPEGPHWAQMGLSGKEAELPLENMILTLVKMSTDRRKAQVTARIINMKKPYVLPEVSDFRLKASNGRTLDAAGVRAGQRDVVSLELRFEIPEGFEASFLLVRHFKGIGEHAIPFEFKDVPLR